MLSYVSSMAASISGLGQLGMWLGAPAVALSGWAFIGHLVTIDDDAPGEWSNPEGSKKLWHYSLGELALKTIIFGALVIVVYLQS